jgi:hypothetical protein
MTKNNHKPKAKSKPINFDLGLFLLVTGGASNAVVWVGAFTVTESGSPVSAWIQAVLLPILGGISGLAMAITAAFGLVYVIARLSTMKPSIEHKIRNKDEYKSVPNVRFYVALAAVVILLVISPALLASYVYMGMAGETGLFAVLGPGWSWVWSVGRILAADLAISAVAMVRGVHSPAIATPIATSQGAAGAAQSGKSATRTAKKSGKTAKDVRPCEVPGCGIPFKWPHGKGAHYKQYHPDLIIRKSIPVNSIPQPKKEEAKP